MNKVYDINGLPISVSFNPGLVSIVCDMHLWQLADRRQRSDFVVLVYRIYHSHQVAYGHALGIRECSFLLEIYAHIYADYYLLRYPAVFRALLGRKRYVRFLQSCEEIDCGDRQRDPNRWFWDILSTVGLVFVPLSPKNISGKYAK